MRIKRFNESLISEDRLYDITSVDDLKSILIDSGIDVNDWGKGYAKTIEHLYREVVNNECVIRIKDGRLVRYIEFVGVRIYYNGLEKPLKLVEYKQVFKDGRTRKRNMASSVSEKMIFGEDPEIAAIRGVEEELGVKIKKTQLDQLNKLDFSDTSMSYPGLDTVYKGHQFECLFDDSQFNKDGYVERQSDKSTYFKWI